MTEVVELVKTHSTPSFGQLPYYHLLNGVGAMFGNSPILCGGYKDFGSFPRSLDTCITYQDSQWSQSYSMILNRKGAAGVQVNSTTFWILGGYYFDASYPSSSVYIDSTEFIIQGQSNGVPGPKLPYGMLDMCVVKLSENEIFVMGGRNESSVRNEVWIYDPQNGFARNQGPSLNTGRYAHSCSTMRHGKKTIIIAAGGLSSMKNLIKFVEIYDPTDNTWHSGKPYPN